MTPVDQLALEPIHPTQAEVLPAEPRRSRLWPLVGGVLVWAARELLPEVITAWQASRADVSQVISDQPDTSRLVAPTHRRNGRRHRWRRV